jgi:hypothetical protein
MSSYGKGKAILIGSYIGLIYYQEQVEDNAEFIIRMLKNHTDITTINISQDKKVRIDLLTLDKQTLLIVQNKENEEIEVEIHSNFNGCDRFIEQFDNSVVEVFERGENKFLSMTLKQKEVKVYRDAVL